MDQKFAAKILDKNPKHSDTVISWGLPPSTKRPQLVPGVPQLIPILKYFKECQNFWYKITNQGKKGSEIRKTQNFFEK